MTQAQARNVLLRHKQIQSKFKDLQKEKPAKKVAKVLRYGQVELDLEF